MTQAYQIGQYFDTIPVEKAIDLTPSQSGPWFVLRTELGREQTAQANLLLRRIPFYMPTLLRPARLSLKRHEAGEDHEDIRRPMFPRMIFVAENVVSDRVETTLRSTPGVCSQPFLQIGDCIARLFGAGMDLIRMVEASERQTYLAKRGRAVSGYDPAIGDKVRVLLKHVMGGYSGTIADMDDDGRITVLMEIMKRMVRVKVTADQIEPV